MKAMNGIDRRISSARAFCISRLKQWQREPVFIEQCMVWAMLGLTLALAGCADTIYPVTTGYHIPVSQETLTTPRRVVVWSNNSVSERAIVDGMQKNGHTVIGRAQLQTVLDKQRATTTSPDENIVAAAKLLEPDRIIVSEVTLTPSAVDQAGYYPGDREARNAGPLFSRFDKSGSAFLVSVTVRSIDVVTGELRWRGSASYPRPILSPEKGVVSLTRLAIEHAKCLVRARFEWKELDETGGGCVLK